MGMPMGMPMGIPRGSASRVHPIPLSLEHVQDSKIRWVDIVFYKFSNTLNHDKSAGPSL